ncbi:hypothetical protein AUJ17_03675 [Candidatus Micrarchaeota archaeon CG1_02_47_40]|nr:MAG: hypothetical protein AUJ17_03675 [Candidatus Micrarchaeota archaeon CG1_02_47_40]
MGKLVALLALIVVLLAGCAGIGGTANQIGVNDGVNDGSGLLVGNEISGMFGNGTFNGTNASANMNATTNATLKNASANALNNASTNGSASMNASINATLKNASTDALTNANASMNTSINLSKDKVTLEFLYADWCGHCARMKPVVEEVSASLPKDRFEVIMLSEKDAQSKPEVMAIYQKYAQTGIFSAYPTFIINGEHQKVGEMPEEEFMGWVCGYFEEPKPQYCLAA